MKSHLYPMRYLLLGIIFAFSACSLDEDPSSDIDLSLIRLPDGFEISLFATDVPNARSMVRSPGGTLFVGNRQGDKVFALRDTDGDNVADQKFVIAEGLLMPNGVAFLDGALFVAEVSRILRFDDIENNLESPPDPVVVYDDFPTDRHHGWKYIAFGPDGKLYVPVGAPCNSCDRDAPYASIYRMNPDGSGFEEYALGVRNTVGFDWHPETDELWFTDNGRDNMGDDIPPCELNHAPVAGMDFGFPHIHAGSIPDPEFGEGYSAADFTPPAMALGPHVAPLGMEFYTGMSFPASYEHQILIAEHGSWNRTEKIGYRITLVTLDENQNAMEYSTFAEGWLQGQEAWGRPVDLELLPDGSLLISDDLAGVIYRIAYTGSPDIG
jgi:glucose/arabinose dehydrogenase